MKPVGTLNDQFSCVFQSVLFKKNHYSWSNMADTSAPIVSVDVTSEDDSVIPVNDLDTPLDVYVDCDMNRDAIRARERRLTSVDGVSLDVNTGGDVVALRVQIFVENIIAEGSILLYILFYRKYHWSVVSGS